MNKILYWIGTNFTHYCIAKSIQEKVPTESYAIFDVTNKPKKFFENENIVNFQKKWFLHENILDIQKIPDLEYLSEFETKYNIQLSKIIFCLSKECNTYYSLNKNILVQNNDKIEVIKKESY